MSLVIGIWSLGFPGDRGDATVFRGQSEAVFPPLAPPVPEEEPLPPRPLIPPPPALPELPLPAGPEVDQPGRFPTAGRVPLEPLMAYTRLFNGSEAELTAAFRDYLELQDDLRWGGWRKIRKHCRKTC